MQRVSQGQICPISLICSHTIVFLFVGCLTSQQQASVPQGRICSDNCTCCYTELEAVDQTFHLTLSQYSHTGPTSPSADSITPGAWQGSTGVPMCKSPIWLDQQKSWRKQESNPGSAALEADALTTRPTRRCVSQGQICPISLTCRHTMTEDAYQTISPTGSLLTPGRQVLALTL